MKFPTVAGSNTPATLSVYLRRSLECRPGNSVSTDPVGGGINLNVAWSSQFWEKCFSWAWSLFFQEYSILYSVDRSYFPFPPLLIRKPETALQTIIPWQWSLRRSSATVPDSDKYLKEQCRFFWYCDEWQLRFSPGITECVHRLPEQTLFHSEAMTETVL